MLERIDGQAQGAENLFGTTPRYADLNWNGTDFSEKQFTQITSIDETAWKAELALHTELFDKLHHHLPPELAKTRQEFEKRLAA